MGFFRGVMLGILGAKNLKYIPKAIVYLANDPNPLGAAFDEIKFPQLLAYAEVNGSITTQESNYFEFTVNLEGRTYYVRASRAIDGSNCAIMHSLNNIEQAVLSVAQTHSGSSLGTTFPEIHYFDVLDFIRKSGVETKIVGDGTTSAQEFQLDIMRRRYDVHFSSKPDGTGGAIFRVRESEEWLDELYEWLTSEAEASDNFVKFFLPTQSAIVIGSATSPECRPDKPCALPASIGKLTNLNVLGLIHRKLIAIPSEIGKLHELVELKLGGNSLTELPVEVCQLSRLRILTLWSNFLKQLPDEIGNLRDLEGLDISWNGLLRLPESIAELTSLKRLYMLGNDNLRLSKRQESWLADLISDGAEIAMEQDRYDRLRLEYPELPAK